MTTTTSTSISSFYRRVRNWGEGERERERKETRTRDPLRTNADVRLLPKSTDREAEQRRPRAPDGGRSRATNGAERGRLDWMECARRKPAGIGIGIGRSVLAGSKAIQGKRPLYPALRFSALCSGAPATTAIIYVYYPSSPLLRTARARTHASLVLRPRYPALFLAIRARSANSALDQTRGEELNRPSRF